MKSYWIGKRNNYRLTIKRYLLAYRMSLPDDADVIMVTDDNGQLCAFSILSTNRVFSDVLFFLVFEDFRRKGFGSFMLSEIIDSLKESGVSLLRCLLPFGEGFHELFTSQGFDIFPGRKEYGVPFGAFHYSETYVKAIEGKDPAHAVSVKDCTEAEKLAVRNYFRKNDISDKMGYDRELSVVSFDRGKVAAVMLCERKPGTVMIEILRLSAESPKFVYRCFRVLDSILTSMGEETYSWTVVFATGDGKDLELARFFSRDPSIVKEIVWEETAVLNLQV